MYEEYLNTIRDGQSNITGDVPDACPTKVAKESGGRHDLSWTAAYPLIAGWIHKYYGETTAIRDHWPSLVKYIDGVTQSGVSSPHSLPQKHQFGDWCAVASRAISRRSTGPELAAFNYILSLDSMVSMAGAIGDNTAVAKYSRLAHTMRGAFRAVFFNSTSQRYGDSHELLIQSLNVAPLALGGGATAGIEQTLVSKLHADIVQRDFHFTVGSVGAKHLLPQLSAHGLHSDAMKIATQTTFPSFGYWLSQGATTCWEDYSGIPSPSHPPTPTHNHIFLCGGAGEWLYRTVLGVAPASPGWRDISVAPLMSAEGPAAANGSVHTVLGRVAVAWTRGGAAPDSAIIEEPRTLSVTVPAGAVARVSIPLPSALPAGRVSITEGQTRVFAAGKFVIDKLPGVHAGDIVQTSDGTMVSFAIDSGSYMFSVQEVE
eukprot:COSAG01_NODE_4613_length_4878_cov_6.267211_2_plen_429_part_00